MGANRARSIASLVAHLISVGAALPGISATGQEARSSRPEWFAYDRSAEYEVVEERDTIVPTRDGTELACDLFRPGRDGEALPGPYPGLVADFNPYGKSAANTDGFFYFVERGYVVLKCDVRGSGQSPGEFDPLSKQEAEDNYDVVEWLATRPFVDGQVAQFGGSYGGVTAYRVAGLRPPHLVTIVPQFAYQDWYRDWVYLGGLRNGDSRAVYAVFNQSTQGRAAHLEQEWRDHPLYDAYWRERSVMAIRDRIRVPVLGFGGWYDLFQDGMPANHMAMPKRHRLVMGPWEHSELPAQPLEPVAWGALLAWFDHWLLELPDAPLPARATAYEMPSGTGTWRQYASWPPPRTRRLRLHLSANNALAETAGDAGEHTYVVNPADPAAGGYKGGPQPWAPTGDQRAQDAARLTYTTSRLPEDLIVAGRVTVSLKAVLDGEDGSLVVKLLDVSPDGSSSWVSTGWLRASHRPSHSTVTPVEPGRATRFEVAVWASHWRFRAGHSLRLVVESGDLPRIEPDISSRTVTVKVGRGGSLADLRVLQESE
jgi:predicted acyl esterase